MRRLSDVVPSAVTFTGLWLAIWALTLVAEGRFETAAWVLFAATLTDNVDGLIARALGSDSAFGKQLDSLADLVTAGVAPAFFAHQAYFDEWGAAGFALTGLWATAVAARLARFNSDAPGSSLYFVGVPCPIAGTMLVQYLVFSQETYGDNGSRTVAAVIVVGMSALMLSRLPYWKTTTLLPRYFFTTTNSIGTTGMIIGLIFIPRQALFLTMVCSIVLAVGEMLWRRRSGSVSDGTHPGRTAPPGDHSIRSH